MLRDVDYVLGKLAWVRAERIWPNGLRCLWTDAFANYGVALGLQAVDRHPERVARLNAYFETYRSGDEYDREAITHVMACAAHLPGRFIAASPANNGP
jgi:hypothetical protein